MISKKIQVETMDELIKIFGPFDENIKCICTAFDVKVVVQDGQSSLMGEESNVDLAMRVVDKLKNFIYNGDNIDIGRVNYLCDCAKADKLEEIDQLLNDVVAITSRGKPIKSKTVGQKKYVDLMKKNTITFGVGPAGTGKTYLAVALAVNAFKAKQVEKIILTRPAVEAGEKLGFLPGDLQEKVNPYLRPLYDALQEMLGIETYSKMMERGTIEIAPLAYMRGRTLNNAYVILDEAQNTTKEQIKMFLTRLGEGSRMVITGDLTQVDLPRGHTSGLRHAIKILKDIEDIGIIKLSERDVVRHPLVQKIVKAYQSEDK
ncbi:MAG: PhoH family protein [Clostridia bacterium]|nr:PhoH family protein [Clostridia bacterium]MBQ8505511.1 PhoH family protein [Clostridia bacterium]MBQ8771860.1 PhoH family protein [Clostridia bacterium]MBQ9707419.1 PhoH family protein [Clostridia bacterium]